MRLDIVIDLGPKLLTLGGKLVGLFEDLQAKLQELQDAAASEHTQVTAAIEALQAKIGSGLTADQKITVDDLFSQTKAAIGGVFEETP